MKITIKTLKGQLFTVEAQPQQTIQDLKTTIKSTKGYEVDAQKLVFKGKNTVNTDVIENLGIKEGDFMVVMVTAKKTQAPKPVQQPKVEQKPKQVPKPVVEPIKPVNPQVSKPVNVNPSNVNNPTQSHLVVGQQYQATVLQLMNMGFERQQVVNALKAAFNNPERAVEYLLNGIPKGHVQNPPQQQQAQQSQQSQQIPLTGSLDPTLLANIINSPQFAQIKQMIRNDPSSLAGFLQQIENSSPQMAQLIQQNPQLFERLIMEDAPGQQLGQQNPPPGSIMVTNQQKAAIDRLAALGFSKIQAAQVYMACDKNEQLAANLLFDRLQNGDIESGQNFPEEGPEQPDNDDDNLFH